MQLRDDLSHAGGVDGVRGGLLGLHAELDHLLDELREVPAALARAAVVRAGARGAGATGAAATEQTGDRVVAGASTRASSAATSVGAKGLQKGERVH